MTVPHQQELLDRMRAVVRRAGSALAVREAGGSLMYDEFEAAVGALRRAMTGSGPHSGAPVGLLLDRSATAYAAMWAAVSLGRAYVPLNPRYPASRLAQMINQAGVEDIVCTSQHAESAAELGTARARIVYADQLSSRPCEEPDSIWKAARGGSTAYILFTSGSTGRPKGVPISYVSLLAFVDAMAATIPLEPDDVCSQVSELSFDFSVHEIYLALLSGSTLCPARTIDLFNPVEYVARNDLTVWIAVPSLARVALRAGPSVGNRLDGLRLSIFNGEALTAELAAEWQRAAPNSTIWNTYGPTECTVAVTSQRWTGDDELVERGVVSIGTPLPQCRAAIDDGAEIVAVEKGSSGATGELLLAGPQRFDGYLDAALESPFSSDGDVTWYRTGDQVLWSNGRLYHRGRRDHQVKIGGHRIELGEVEHRLRSATGTESLAVIAHPLPTPTELVLFTTEQVHGPITAAATGLPTYMLPHRIVSLPTLPTNAHGKVDRQALQRMAGMPS